MTLSLTRMSTRLSWISLATVHYEWQLDDQYEMIEYIILTPLFH